MASTIQSIDTGNYQTKVFDGQNVTVTQSLIAQLLSGTKMTTVPSETTRMLHYLGGSRKDLVGKMYIIGAGAEDRASAKPLAEHASKTQMALQLILACLQLPETGGHFALTKLALFLPEIAVEWQMLIDSVEGEHSFVVNGVNHRIEIPREAISVFQEGSGVNHFVRQRGLVSADEYLGVLDVGGGTFIGSLFNQSGELIDESRRIVGNDNRWGVYSGLATMISGSPLFVQGLGKTGDPQLIASAIARAEYESVPDPQEPTSLFLHPKQPLIYGTTGFDFSDIFSECNTAWTRACIREVWATWSHWQSRIGRIVVSGGGAPLLSAFINHPDQQRLGKFFIPYDSAFPHTNQVANAVGGYGMISSDVEISGSHPFLETSLESSNGRTPEVAPSVSRK